jgi:hypothetical protein
MYNNHCCNSINQLLPPLCIFFQHFCFLCFFSFPFFLFIFYSLCLSRSFFLLSCCKGAGK